MREIQRTIVSALIWSKDGKILMGRKDPAKGGVYPDAWHLPGGGVDGGENLEQALRREINEEIGIDVSRHRIVHIPKKGKGSSEKTLKNGEKVLVHMEFNYFEVHIDRNYNEIKIKPSDDLIELHWFGKDELPDVKQIPRGKKFFQEIGYID